MVDRELHLPLSFVAFESVVPDLFRFPGNGKSGDELIF